MASSGTYTFSPSNGELILAAYERCQIRAPSLRQQHFRTAYREMNLAMVKLSNRGPNLWKVALSTIGLVQGTATYPIPSNVVMILSAYRSLNYGMANQTDIITSPIGRDEYASYASKPTPGPPIVWWFDRTPPNQTVTFFPTPDGGGPYTFAYYAFLQMQDANTASGETPDVPYLWLDALTGDLAWRLARVYAPPLEAARKQDAKESWDIAAEQNTENVPVAIAPSIGSYYRR